ncbi:hypothetical protein D3C78_707900 [compost metagenome]
MGRAEQVFDRRVVFGLLVGVANQQADGATGGTALENPGKDFDFIGFLTLGGVPAGAGLAPVEVVLQVGQGNFQARRTAVDNGDQRRTMAFASGGDSEQLAVGIAGHAGRSANQPDLNKAASIRRLTIQFIPDSEPSAQAPVKKPTPR